MPSKLYSDEQIVCVWNYHCDGLLGCMREAVNNNKLDYKIYFQAGFDIGNVRFMKTRHALNKDWIKLLADMKAICK